MKKFFLLPLLLSICLSASAQSSAELSFGALTCGYDPGLGDYYDVEIVLDNRLVPPCAGFQFEITNILIDSLYGGWIDQYGWGPYTSFNDSAAVDTGRVLGFSLAIPYLPPDSGVLTMMRFTNPKANYNSCLTNFVYSDSVPNAVPTIVGACLDLSPKTYTLDSAMCDGDSVILGGMYQYVAGSYYDTLMAVNGCDSIIRTLLAVNATYEFRNTVTVCAGDSVMVDNVVYTDAGTYYDSLQTAKGCDSVFILEIILDPTYEIRDTIAICSGDSAMINGTYYGDAQTFYDSMLTVQGCDSLFVTDLNVNALPVPVITQSGNDLTSSSAVSYQWHSSDTALTGATSQTYTVTASGLYSVMVTDANGCSGNSDTVVVTIASLAEFAILPILQVFPNPMTDQAIVQFDRSDFKGPYTILVYNVLGEKQLEVVMASESQAIIQRNDLAPGIYFIELEGTSTTLVGKFLIK